jgi:CHAT domain-containing protein/tetratricopeptide (TPR) repeat protein
VLNAQTPRRGLSLRGRPTLALAAIVTIACERKAPAERRFDALLAALPSTRTLEAPLSRIPYRPFEPRAIATGSAPLRLRAAAAGILAIAENEPTSLNLHRAGIAHLLMDAPGPAMLALESAIRLQTAATSLETAIDKCRDESLLRDFAVAALQHANGGNDVGDLSIALQAADRALELSATSTETRFTRSLILERLELRDDALESWQETLKSAPHSDWRDETDARLRSLRNRANAKPHGVNIADLQRRFENSCVVGWSGQHPDETFLANCEHIAGAIMLASGDRLYSDTVEGMRVAQNERAYAMYAEALRSYQDLSLEDALRGFQRAATEFEKKQDPFAQIAHLRAGSCLFQLNRYELALANAIAVARDTRLKHGSLHAKARWLAGLCRLALYQPLEAIADYEAALDVAVRCRDYESIVALQSLLAEAYNYAGDLDKASLFRRNALRDAYRYGEKRRLQVVLSEAAGAAIDAYRVGEARVTIDRLTQVSVTLDDPSLVVDAMTKRALLMGAIGNSAEGRSAIVDARRWASRIRDPAIRDRMDAFVEVAAIAVGIPPANNPESNAVEFYRRTGNAFGLSDAFARRGRLFAMRGDLAAAQTNFERALDIARVECLAIPDRTAHDTFVEQRQELFNDLVDVAWRQSRWRQALQFSELSRGALLRGDSAPWRIPPSTTVLQYHVTAERAYAWVLADNRVVSVLLPVSPRALRAITARLQNEIAKGSMSNVTLRDLHGALIEPVEQLLHSNTIAIVPDKEIGAVPFSALRDRKGSYLVERFRVALIPSLACLDRQIDETSSLNDLALIVASDTASGAAILPMAFGEADDVARLYKHPVVLKGRSASIDGVLETAKRARVIHIIAHAVANYERPSLSSIMLGDPSRPAILYARDIATIRLAGSPTVILNACDTGTGGGKRAGPNSLATAFIAAGASEVVSTLWPVDDAAAAAFAVTLHRRLRSGEGAAYALRAMQLASIRSSSPTRQQPFLWAAYQIVGLKERDFHGHNTSNDHPYGDHLSDAYAGRDQSNQPRRSCRARGQSDDKQARQCDPQTHPIHPC